MKKPLFLIAPMNMHKDLIAFYRKADAFSDVKAMSIEELYMEFFGGYKIDVIKDLAINYNLKRDNAYEIATYFPFIDLKKEYSDIKLKNLQRYKANIKEEYKIHPNYYINELFFNREILIYGYSKYNQELNKVLELIKNKDVKYLSLGDDKKIEYIETYADSDFETLGVLNNIASLIDKGVNINDIYILYKDDIYSYYLDIYKDDFGFNINIPKKISYASIERSKEFLAILKKSRSLDEAIKILDIENEIDKGILDIVSQSNDERFLFDHLYEFIYTELEETYLPYERYSNAVNVISSYSFLKNKYIFVLGFKQGKFPSIYKDNNYLPDKLKKLVNCSTSIQKAYESEELYKQFFTSDNHFYLSFSYHDISTNNFPSPLAKILHIDLKEHEYQKIRYSLDYAKFDLTVAKDLYRLYLEKSVSYSSLSEKVDISYREYDNQYTPVHVYFPNSELTYSYSQINQYYACPFAYYLDRILDLSSFESNFNTKLGNLAHKIFERQNEPDFDFDDEFLTELNNQGFEGLEKIFATNLKEQIYEAAKTINLHQKNMQKPYNLTEFPLKWRFSKHASLVGKIDKVTVTDNKYLFLVDYKTGSESFSAKYLNYGRSMQLPTYALLARHDERLNKYELSGVYINHVIDKSLTHQKEEGEPIYTYLKLEGLSIDNIEVMKTYDSDINYGKSTFIYGLALEKTNSAFTKRSRIVSKDELNDMVELTESLYIKADENIRNNRFEIHPFYADENTNACKYCEYKGICFRRIEQRNVPVKEEQKEGSENE